MSAAPGLWGGPKQSAGLKLGMVPTMTVLHSKRDSLKYMYKDGNSEDNAF